MILNPSLATLILERAKLRTHCQSVENRLLLSMSTDEVNALTRFLDSRSTVWTVGIKHNPAKPYLVGWGKQGILQVAGRNRFQITPLGEAIRRKLFGERMGGCGKWVSGCACPMCEGERKDELS